jgi:hypothetical protein
MSDFPIRGLLVAFAAGFSIQQLLEIIDPLASSFLKTDALKKSVLSLTSLVLGGVIASVGQMHIFHILGAVSFPGSLDTFLSAVFISAGTEGFNSILKFANYKKEEAKALAAGEKSKLSPKELSTVNFQAIPSASK